MSQATATPIDTFQNACGYYELHEPLLTIQNVSKFRDGKPILYQVNQQIRNIVRPKSNVEQGQVVAILGPSGIGKTTLFNIMAGLEDPDAGQVLVTDQQVPVRQGMVGVVYQDYPQYDFWTVAGNLTEAAKQAGFSRADAKVKMEEKLTQFDLVGQRGQYPNQLSGGQRQRLAVAQALLRCHETLLMDEPFSGQDLLRLHETCKIIQAVAQMNEKFTIGIVTHDIGAALTVADTVWIMGRVRSPEGQLLGAQFVQAYDLIEREIAWRPDNRFLPQFAETRREIETIFPRL